jgi:formate hydrogenlyase subunit 3/multisubunit Na+/H+ antiporter MnhD subunit
MTIDMWLRIGAIGLPLIAALIMWLWGDRFLRAQGWLVTLIFGLIGLTALTLFLLNRHYACILLTGRQNCLFEGLATLTLFLLSLVLVRGCIVLRGINKGYDYVLMLLLSSAWAGIGLTENLFVLLIFLNLFLYVIHRWLNSKGLIWRILILRDDYIDDRK